MQENSESEDKQRVKKKEKNLSHIECLACGENGHYAQCMSFKIKQTKQRRAWCSSYMECKHVCNLPSPQRIARRLFRLQETRITG